MISGDLITVLGRYDVGRITAIETAPHPQTDQPVEFVCAEFTEGLLEFHPWEITSCRPVPTMLGGKRTLPNIRLIPAETYSREIYQE